MNASSVFLPDTEQNLGMKLSNFRLFWEVIIRLDVVSVWIPAYPATESSSGQVNHILGGGWHRWREGGRSW